MIWLRSDYKTRKKDKKDKKYKKIYKPKIIVDARCYIHLRWSCFLLKALGFHFIWFFVCYLLLGPWVNLEKAVKLEGCITSSVRLTIKIVMAMVMMKVMVMVIKMIVSALCLKMMMTTWRITMGIIIMLMLFLVMKKSRQTHLSLDGVPGDL